MYSNYCATQSQSLQRLAELQKQRNIAEALKKASESPELGGRTLKDYLIKPVQRIWCAP